MRETIIDMDKDIEQLTKTRNLKLCVHCGHSKHDRCQVQIPCGCNYYKTECWPSQHVFVEDTEGHGIGCMNRELKEYKNIPNTQHVALECINCGKRLAITKLVKGERNPEFI